MSNTKKRTTCSRGHTFERSSDRPTCPICWPGQYKKKAGEEFEMLAAPAQRALMSAKITKLEQLAQLTEEEVFCLHGMGPKALEELKAAMKERKLSFAKENKPR